MWQLLGGNKKIRESEDVKETIKNKPQALSQNGGMQDFLLIEMGLWVSSFIDKADDSHWSMSL